MPARSGMCVCVLRGRRGIRSTSRVIFAGKRKQTIKPGRNECFLLRWGKTFAGGEGRGGAASGGTAGGERYSNGRSGVEVPVYVVHNFINQFFFLGSERGNEVNA
jgi:hypothetical protein